MKKTILLIILGLIAILALGQFAMHYTEEKEAKEKELKLQRDKYVYVDSLRCLHTNSRCINLFDNYAVKLYDKTDPNLESKYDYVCSRCFKPSHMNTSDGRVWDKFED